MIPQAIRAYFHGMMGAFRMPVAVFLKWLLNGITALWLTAAFLDLWQKDLNHGRWGGDPEKLLSLEYLYEFQQSFESQLGSVFGYWLAVLLLFVLLNLLLTGGILASLREGHLLARGPFLARGRGHFFSLMWLGAIWGALGLIALFSLGSVSSALALDAWPRWAMVIFLVLLGCAALLALLTYNQARVLVCWREPSGISFLLRPFTGFFEALTASFKALWFVLVHPAAWLLALAFLVTQLALLWLHRLALGLVHPPSGLGVVAILGMGQMWLWLRITTNLGSLAALQYLWGGHQQDKSGPKPSTGKRMSPPPPLAPEPSLDHGRALAPSDPEAGSHDRPVADGPLSSPVNPDEPASQN